MQNMIELCIRTVLFATDLSESSSVALSYAAGIASKYQAKLLLVHVLDPSAPAHAMESTLSDMRKLGEWAKAELGETQKSLTGQGIANEILIRYGNVRDTIFQVQQHYAADILVLGSSGRRIGGGRALGSVAEAVLRGMPCTVLTIGPGVERHVFPGKAQSVLLPTDFSATSLAALPHAVSFAAVLSAKLLLLHVFDAAGPNFQGGDDAGRARKLAEITASAARLGVSVEDFFRTGEVAAGILSFAQEKKADLIVMGVHGGDLNDGTRLHGRVHEVVRSARCPVLTVAAPARPGEKEIHPGREAAVQGAGSGHSKG